MGQEDGGGQEWDLTTTFKVGEHWKIEERGGRTWTATITKVEPDRVHFKDREGVPAGLHRDDIKKYRKLQITGTLGGESDG
jgi:hypothetical protein